MYISHIKSVSTQINNAIITVLLSPIFPKNNFNTTLLLHSHLFTELFTCREGSIEITLDDSVIVLNSGDIAIMPSSLAHKTTPKMTDASSPVWYCVQIECKKCDYDDDCSTFDNLNGVFSVKDPIVLRNKPDIIDLIYQMPNAETTDELFELSTKLSLHLCLLLSEFSVKSDPKKKGETKNLNATLMLLDEILNTDVNHSKKEIAELLHISERQLSRIVHKYYGVPLHTLILNKRIENAAFLLLNSNLSVEEIAFSIGFNNKKSFYEQFKRMYNTTPLQYRKREKFVEE